MSHQMNVETLLFRGVGVPLIQHAIATPVANARILWQVSLPLKEEQAEDPEVKQLPSGYLTVQGKGILKRFALFHTLQAVYDSHPFAPWKAFWVDFLFHAASKLTLTQLDLSIGAFLPDDGLPLYQFVPVITCMEMASKYIVSPLDILRTRMIVQTSKPSRKYKSLPSSLQTMFLEDGAWSLYAGINAQANLLSYATQAFTDSLRGIAVAYTLGLYTGKSEVNAVSYIAVDLSWDFLTLLVTTPIQTIQRRIHLQTIKDQDSFDTIVPIPRSSITSLYDCYQKTLDENQGNYWNAFYRGFTSKLISLAVRKIAFLTIQIMVASQQQQMDSEEPPKDEKAEVEDK